MKRIIWLIKISRFPHFWVSICGVLLLGAVLGGADILSPSRKILTLLFWFMIPGNIFLNGINDAFDSRTDAYNPRKRIFEIASKEKDKPLLLTAAFISLVSAALIYGSFTPLTALIFVAWASDIIVYNVPPFRFKGVPGLNVIFGATGHFIPILMIGYASAAGELPSPQFFLTAFLFVAATHIFGDALDAKYDKAAGIRTLSAVLGPAKISFGLSVALYLAAIAMAFVYGNGWLALSAFVFPAFALTEISKGSIEKRTDKIYRRFFYLYTAYGIAMVFLFYFSVI